MFYVPSLQTYFTYLNILILKNPYIVIFFFFLHVEISLKLFILDLIFFSFKNRNNMCLPRAVAQNLWAWCLSVARLSWAFAVAGAAVASVRDRNGHDRQNRRSRHIRLRRRLDVDTRPPNR